MNKFNQKFFFLYMLVAGMLISCGGDDTVDETPDLGKFQKGVFIVNEGNFLSSNASVTYFDPENTTLEKSIYFDANGQIALGDVAQSYLVDGDIGYIVVNNSNTLEVVNANTFESTASITFELPRYFEAFNGKGYLSEWVSFTDTGRVSVIDLATLTTDETIDTGFGAENLIAVNGKLYVSNNFQSDISVIDLSTNQVMTSIEVGSGPGAFVLDANEDLWVAIGGGSDADFAPLNNGALVKISTADNSVAMAIGLEVNISPKIAMNVAKNAIYYFKTDLVFKVNITDTEKPMNAFITEASAISFYGVGVDPTTDVIYLGDSKAFQSNGQVFRYNADGSAIDDFEVGIGPSSFVFK